MPEPIDDQLERVGREAARGQAEHTPWTVHGAVIVVVAIVVGIVTALLLALYFTV